MKLNAKGIVIFDTCKELVEYIESFSLIECRRKVLECVRDTALDYDLLGHPSVEVDDEDGLVSVSGGDLDEARLIDYLYQAGVCGITIEVDIGQYNFYKLERGDRWECDAKYPSVIGYVDEELKEKLREYGVYDIDDLINNLLDAITDWQDQYMMSYRAVQSEDDDVTDIIEQLLEIKCDGFYVHEFDYENWKGKMCKGTSVYAWSKGMKSPFEGFDEAKKIDALTAAKILVEDL